MPDSKDAQKDDLTTSDDKPAGNVHDGCDANDFFSQEGKRSLTYKITEKMAYHPIKISCCLFLFILAVSVITFASGLAVSSKASEYDWAISGTSESENLDALTDAVNRVDLVASIVLERSGELENKFYYIHESSDGSDIYTPANLFKMCRIESTMLAAKGYSEVCHLAIDGNCTLPSSSIVVYFYEFESVEDWKCTLLNSSHVNDKKQPIYDGLANPEGREAYGTWLSSDAVSLGYSTRCNSYWSFGTPLPGYESDNDRKEEQFEVYQEFLAALDGSVKGVEAELFDTFSIDDNADGFFPYYPTPYMASPSLATLRVYWFSVFNLQNEFVRMLASDLFFTIFSILFVVFWLRMHTGSTLMAITGIFMIVMSLPFTILIYKKIFNIPFYSELHNLVIFIVLGVGADDVFVLSDSWKLTRHNFPADITNGRDRETAHRRLLKCYRHTMSTVFNTSFTTSMAFIATGLSPLMPIATFGWFAATCIVVNYVFVITLMPPIAVISEMYFENSYIPCREKKKMVKLGKKAAAGEPVAIGASAERADVESSAPASKGEGAAREYSQVASSTTEQEESSTSAVSTGVEMVAVPGKEEAVLGAGEGDGEELQGVVPSLTHNNDLDHQKGSKSDAGKAMSTDSELDGSDISHSEPKGVGSIILEIYISVLEYSVDIKGYKLRIVSLAIMISLFVYGVVGIIYGLQLTPPTSQESWFPEGHMLSDAQSLLSTGFLGFDDAAYAPISISLGIAGIDRSGFNPYIPGKNRGDVKFHDDFVLAEPMCQKAVVRMCEEISRFKCDASACKPTGLLARQNSTRCFMADFREWSSTTFGEDTYAMNETHFYNQLGKFRHETVEWQDDIGFVNGELKFVTVSFISTMESEQPMQQKLDVQDNVEGLMRKISKLEECNSCNCHSIIYSSPYAFVWMRTEMGLVTGFYQGMYIAFPVAFFVLLFATGNILISFYAILTVLFIVFGVLGFVNYSLHWDLGVAESIAGIIIIGFSVDYTVHIGHMFTDAENQLGHRDRLSKFEHASREIVPTIVGGAITTAGAGCFMFLCQLMFFFKMAALIVSTIVLSYIYSLGFFMSLLLVMGPVDDEGKIGVYVDWFKAKLGLAGWHEVGGKKVIAADRVSTQEQDDVAL